MTGRRTVTGQTNTITVIDDGLYIHQDSGDTADITLTATGSDVKGIGNYIDGNNGIHTAGENKGNINGYGKRRQERHSRNAKTPYMQAAQGRLLLAQLRLIAKESLC